MKEVKIVGFDSAVQRMFVNKGWRITSYSEINAAPDIICFTGGEDIQPKLYNEIRLDCTHCDEYRDNAELNLYRRFSHLPKVGICRGAQFLNVMSDGSMWQDVNNHSSSHDAIDVLFTKKPIKMSSVHHQMMIPGPDALVLAFASEATEFISATAMRPKPPYDPEVIWYEKTNSLCFQPHPEYPGYDDCTDYFFELIDYFYG